MALIAAGALFLIAALIGHLPTRLKFGDNEAEWIQTAGETLAEVAELVPATGRPQVAEAIENLARRQPAVAAQALAGLAYEQMIGSMLRLAVADFNARYATQPHLYFVSSDRDHGADGQIINSSAQRVLVEIKAHNRPLPRIAIEMILAEYARSISANHVRILLISATPASTSAVRYLDEAREALVFVQIDRPEQQSKLNALITQLFVPEGA